MITHSPIEMDRSSHAGSTKSMGAMPAESAASARKPITGSVRQRARRRTTPHSCRVRACLALLPELDHQGGDADGDDDDRHEPGRLLLQRGQEHKRGQEERGDDARDEQERLVLHLPFQTGLRLLRKASMPSRKSWLM